MEFLRAEHMPVADHFLAVPAAAHRRPASAATAYGEACESCYAYVTDKPELWRHARDRHADDPRLTCPERGCGRRFYARAMCRAHRAEHADRRTPLTCELCGRPSRNAVAFDRHTAAAHPSARAAVCRACRTYHGDAASLAAHVHHRHAEARDGGRARPPVTAADVVVVSLSCPPPPPMPQPPSTERARLDRS